MCVGGEMSPCGNSVCSATSTEVGAILIDAGIGSGVVISVPRPGGFGATSEEEYRVFRPLVASRALMRT